MIASRAHPEDCAPPGCRAEVTSPWPARSHGPLPAPPCHPTRRSTWASAPAPAEPHQSAPSEASSTCFPTRPRERDYLIQFQVPEFTCHCPLTGQPDFAHFTIDMVCRPALHRAQEPEDVFLELPPRRRLPREGHQHHPGRPGEGRHRTALRCASRPSWYVRGGIYTNVVAEHHKKGWKPAVPVPLAQLPLETGLSQLSTGLTAPHRHLAASDNHGDESAARQAPPLPVRAPEGAQPSDIRPNPALRADQPGHRRAQAPHPGR